MAVAKKNEFQIYNFLGIQKSNTNPNPNACYECAGFDLRENLGDLITRQGYSVKYAAPVNADHRTKLSSITYLDSDNLYIPDAGGGQEINIRIAKGTLTGEPSNGLYPPPSNKNIILFFSSHQFDGTNWVQKNWDGATTGVYWLNHCLLTVIAQVDVVNTWKLELDFADAAIISNDTLAEWTVYNITRGGHCKVIATYDVGAGQVGIETTTQENTWITGDEIILMRNFIPYTYLTNMYNISASDVTFHKVLNELKIGFGGYENRIGVSIGYNKKYLSLNDIEFGSYTANDIEDLATINNLTLDPFIPTDMEADLSFEYPAGTLAANTYYFKLYGVLDGINYFQIAEGQIAATGSTGLGISPEIKWGTENKRLTKLVLFWSDDEELWWYLTEWNLFANTYDQNKFKITPGGFLRLDSGYLNLHTAADAVALTGGANSVGSWIGYGTISSATATPAPRGGASDAWVLKVLSNGADESYLEHPYSTFKKDTLYDISFWVYSDSAMVLYFGFRYGAPPWQSNYVRNIPAATWTEVTGFIRSEVNVLPTGFYFEGNGVTTYMAIDDFSITQRDPGYVLVDTNATKVEEIQDVIGFAPTREYAKSWDQAIVSQSRTFLINPFIDQRYLNKVFFSPIVGKTFRYDVIPPDNYYQIDGDDLIALEVLSNLDFAALQSGANRYIDSNTGAARIVEYGKGIVARKSLVNFGRHLAYAGENDIHFTDGFNAIADLSDGTIREDYRALTANQKAAIIATREEKDNAYRFYSGNSSSRQELVLTKRGWVERFPGIIPNAYIIAKDGSVWFSNSGVIYEPANTNGDAGTAIQFDWLSVPLDVALMSELKNTDRLYVHYVWVMYSTKSAQTLSPYFFGEGSLIQVDNFIETGAVTRKKKTMPVINPTNNKSYRYIQVGVIGNDTKGQQIIIHSVGIGWSEAPTGVFTK